VAARLGGRTTPASGALGEKGDVRVAGVIRIECKTTSAKSFSITRDMIDRISDAAVASGEVPAIVVEFLQDGMPAMSVAVVPIWVLHALKLLQTSAAGG
jgi:Holliday junction resolvase